MKKTGGEIIIETLKQHGVEYVFGYSGGAALPLFDAIQTVGDGLELVTARHEQGAVHIADGYARASGKPGAIVVTSGPGATNTFTGLMTAHMDNVPLIAITGQVPTHAIGTNAFQETDTTGMSRYITKSSQLVTREDDLGVTVSRAFSTAISKRPGPVLIDVPKDISGAPATTKSAKETADVIANIPENTIQDVIKAWTKAKRPLILAGHGVLIAQASGHLSTLAYRFNTPVTTTLLGKGAFPENDPLSLGMLGMHGTAYANHAVLNADFVLAVGLRFDDRIAGDASVFLKGAYVVHADIDVSEIGRVIQPDIGIVADARTFLETLASVSASLQPKMQHEWIKTIEKYKTTYPLMDTSPGLSMQTVITAVHEKTKGEAIVTTDVGQHQMWAAQFWKSIKPDSWITSGGAGTMGFGFPAAIGAQLAKPAKTVIAFVGDGGFQMTLPELSTAVRYKLPVKIFILDNAYLGMVRQWQEAFYDNRESAVDMVDNPDFVKIAEAYGAAGILIDSSETLQAGIEQAFAITDRPAVIHVKVNRTDNVYPFIPAGAAYTTMQTGPSNVKLATPTGST